jgi:hypothetical protein
VAGAASYNIYWAVSSGVTVASIKITNVTRPYVHTGLTNGQPYYYRLSAVNTYGESSLSSEVSGIPAIPTIPSAPLNTAVTVGNGQNTVSWNASSGATSYNLYWGTSAGITTSSSKISGVTSPYLHLGLANGQPYYYRVTAVNSAGESALSTEVSGTPFNLTIPSAPLSPAVVAGNSQNSVSWSAVSGATSYNLYWGTSPGISLSSTKITGASSPYVHTSLTNGQPYYYRVTAVNAAGESAQSVEVTGTPAATSGARIWTKQLGTSQDDYGYGVATDSSGNIYVTGATNAGLDGNTYAGLTDRVLVKYNASGVKQWTRQFGTASNEYGTGVATDSSGNIYVAGATSGGLDGNSSAGGDDLFLIKYNSSGTKQWTKQLGTVGNDYGTGVVTDSSGNIYITGYTNAGLDGNINAGGNDAFLVKYNSSGTKQWTRQLGTTAEDVALDVRADPSDNIYVAGYTYGGLDGNTNAGLGDMFFIKYNSSGTKQWTKQLGTASYDGASGVATDSLGNIYLAGYTNSGLDGNTSAGLNDLILVKYNSSGTKQWTKQLGTALDESASGVATDSSGNIYVGGYSNGGLDGNTSAGLSDLILVKYSSSGTKQWTKQLGTASYDGGIGVATNSSYVYVCGHTGGGLDGNASSGAQDMVLVNYAQ